MCCGFFCIIGQEFPSCFLNLSFLFLACKIILNLLAYGEKEIVHFPSGLNSNFFSLFFLEIWKIVNLIHILFLM